MASNPDVFPRPFFTIGHSTRSLDEMVALLQEADATFIVDVRKIPRSRRYPHFNVEELPGSLHDQGVGYRHVATLGGRRGRHVAREPSVNGGWRNTSFRNYADYALTPSFEDGLAELIAIGRQRTCAIMCAEAVWWRCHRRIIADHLLARDAPVFHILGPGHIDPAALTPGAEPRDAKVVYPGDSTARATTGAAPGRRPVKTRISPSAEPNSAICASTD